MAKIKKKRIPRDRLVRLEAAVASVKVTVLSMKVRAVSEFPETLFIQDLEQLERELALVEALLS